MYVDFFSFKILALFTTHERNLLHAVFSHVLVLNGFISPLLLWAPAKALAAPYFTNPSTRSRQCVVRDVLL